MEFMHIALMFSSVVAVCRVEKQLCVFKVFFSDRDAFSVGSGFENYPLVKTRANRAVTVPCDMMYLCPKSGILTTDRFPAILRIAWASEAF